MTITITAEEGKLEELKTKLTANLPVTREFTGNELVRLVAPQDDSNTLLLIQEWESSEAYHAYKAWRTETGSSALVPGLVTGPPKVVFSDILF